MFTGEDDLQQNITLYIEREDYLDKCMNRYVLVDLTKIKQVESCHVLFWHPRLKFHLQGDIRLQITPLTVSSDEPMLMCPEDAEDSDCRNISMIGYNDTISCSLPNWPGQCKLNFEPNCNTTLGYREVTYDCPLEPLSKTTMILYPLDMYELQLDNNSIAWLGQYSFTGLNNLNALYLEFNLLTTLSNAVFENLNKLQILSLHNNEIGYLEEGVFQALEYLSDLYLNHNQLVSLPSGIFMNCGRLIYLDLKGNKLTSLSLTLFKGSQEILLLSLADNQILSLDVSTFKSVPSLLLLYLNGNSLMYLPVGIFQDLKLLKLLSLSDNQIVSVNANIFKNVTMLTELDISKNELKTLPAGIFDELKILEVLDLNDNQIISLDGNIFKNLTKLTKLLLEGNMLQTLPTGILEELQMLQYLRLSSNQIVSLDANTFKNTSKLTFLYLHENKLKSIPTYLFEELQWIKTLAISNNQIILLHDDTFKGLTNLFTLYLSQNLLRNISSRLFRDLRNLRFLYLLENQISFIQAGALKYTLLFTLWLQQNQIVNLDKDLFEGLSDTLDALSLRTNKIKHIAVGLFMPLVRLQLLVLSDNEISHLDGDVFQGLYEVRLIDLMVNNLVTLPRTLFRNLTRLESIFLTGNQLKKLNADLFQGLISLYSLHLNLNKFSTFDFDVLKNAINLKDLILNNNTINSIVNIANGSGLEYLNLRHNPLTRITSETLLYLSKNVDLLVSQHEICECYAPNREQCSAENKRSPYLTCDRLMSDRVLLAMMWLIGIGAFSGNIFVLIWRRKVTQKNRVQDFLLNNLAMADFLMSIYMIGLASADIYFENYFPMQSEAWRSGITCRILGAISITSSEASVFFVTLISFDRFISIRFPYSIKKFGQKSVAIAVTFVWIFSLTLGVVPSVLSGTNFKFYDNSHVCIGLPLALTKQYDTTEQFVLPFQEGFQVQTQRVIFTTELKGEITGMYFSSAVFLGLNCLCYIFIVFCYFEIVRAVQRSSKESGRTREMKEQIRLTLRVGMIVATDFLCWFPVIILGILVQTRVLTLPPSVYAWCVTFVLPFNSAINPYLYTISDIVSNRKNK